MTDRYHALIVVLEEPIRSDDAQPIIDAIRMLRGVIDVVPQVTDLDHHLAVTKAKYEIAKRLWDALDSVK